MDRFEHNCISYWLPKINQIVPTPTTVLVTLDRDIGHALFKAFDGEEIGPDGHKWINESLRPAVDVVGLPCFLRTGQTSHKHNWKETCYVTDVDRLTHHVLALIEFSEICDMFGLPWHTWAVRKMLPTKPLAVLPAYGDMPLCRELRCFVRDGELQCAHPYWPPVAIEQGFPFVSKAAAMFGDVEPPPRMLPSDFDELVRQATTFTEEELTIAIGLAKKAGAAVGGYWSVDVLDTERGWYVTDMAIGENSWHWPECEHAHA